MKRRAGATTTAPAPGAATPRVETPALGPARSAPAEPGLPGGGPRVRRPDVILLATQLAVMLETGVPLGEAMRSVQGATADAAFRDLVRDVTGRVESGEPFSRSLERYPRAIPPIMIALLRASEASGTMAQMLDRIAAYLAKEHRIVRQVRGALMYPAFMFLMCSGITVFLLTVIMPRFATIYESRGATLPVATRVLLATSGFLTGHWVACLVAAAASAGLALLWKRSRAGRGHLDWFALHTPVLGGLFRSLYLSRGCRTLGTMIESGVPLLEAISIVRDVTPNRAYERLWDQVDADVRRGRPLSGAMEESKVIPEHVTRMVESGEKAGRLGVVFSRVADYAEAEFDQSVRTATQFIEPVMIVVMGSLIGFVAIALLIPVFGMGKVVAGG